MGSEGEIDALLRSLGRRWTKRRAQSRAGAMLRALSQEASPEHPMRHIAQRDIARILSALLQQGLTEIIEFGPSLGFLDDAQLEALFELALGQLGGRRQGEAESVIARLSLLLPPERVATQLPKLQELRSDEAWRAAPPAEVEALTQSIDQGQWTRAWPRLLQVERDSAREAACARVQLVPQGAAWLRAAGLDVETEPYRDLEAGRCHHLRFKDADLPALLRESDRPLLHPSWYLPATGPALAFGGLSSAPCTHCGAPLHRLVRLSGELSAFGVHRRTLELVRCEACGPPETSYRHDDEQTRTLSEPCPPEPLGAPLPSLGVQLAPTPPRWLRQSWSYANGLENLSRVGGHPSWVQEAEHPRCPSCGRWMCFLLQIDLEPFNLEGMHYSFWCDPCGISKHVWQCS